MIDFSKGVGGVVIFCLHYHYRITRDMYLDLSAANAVIDSRKTPGLEVLAAARVGP